MVLEVGEICRDIAAAEPPGELVPYLVARQSLVMGDVEGGGDGEPVFVLPDLHLLSGDRHYEDYFHLNRRLKDRLMALLRRLEDLRATDPYRDMRVIQIGDFHDLWRERMHWWGEAVTTMLDRQIESHHDLFDQLASLNCHRVVGNHDDTLARKGVLASLREHPISGYFPPGSIHTCPISLHRGVHGRVDLLHGHEVDPGEQRWWSRALNPIGCRFADPALGIGATDEWQHELLPDGTVDAMLDGPPFIYTPGVVDKTQGTNQKFYKELADRMTCADDAPDELRDRFRSAVVIGHTHHPRIVEGVDTCDYVLVDCGSWVNQATVVAQGDKQVLRFWNGQLGILSGPWAAVVQIGAS